MDRTCDTCVRWNGPPNFDAYIPEGYKECVLVWPGYPEYGVVATASTVWLHDDHIDPKTKMLCGPKYGCCHYLSAVIEDIDKITGGE